MLQQVYEQYRQQIHIYAYRLLGNQEDADDVTQEVFTRLCVLWDKLHDHENLSPWLYRVATNLCMDRHRWRARFSYHVPAAKKEFSSSVAVDEEEQFSNSVNVAINDGGIPAVVEREHIRIALSRIPKNYAVILILHAAQGIPYQEIALILGLSSTAAATRLSRAKKMFIEQYQRLQDDRKES